MSVGGDTGWLSVNWGRKHSQVLGAVCCRGLERGTWGTNMEFGVGLDSDLCDLEQVVPLL